MKHLYITVTALFLAFIVCSGQEVKIGETLPAWQEGELDIHFISTGHGESTFMIFPDGTTFLTDASGNMSKSFGKGKARAAKWTPDDVQTPGRTITNYIKHFSPAVSEGHINYFLLTVHSTDHMGGLTKDTPWHSSDAFRLTSLCEVGTNLVMDRIFDRDWPDFSYPKAEASAMMSNYQDFLKWTKRKNKTKIEKWNVGSAEQVVPLHDRTYNFTIRNLAGNGWCWTGNGAESIAYMPPKQVLDILDKDAYPAEGCFSCAYMLTYGKFDFFLGGDLQFGGRDKYAHKDSETPLIEMIHKVEVAKANNHGYNNANSAGLLNKLRPNVWLVGVWRALDQPATNSMTRVLKANPDCEIFCTTQTNGNLGKLVEKIGLEETDRYIVGRYGHVVVRVAQGGGSYMIYTLEDTNEDYVVKSVHGPYQCTD